MLFWWAPPLPKFAKKARSSKWQVRDGVAVSMSSFAAAANFCMTCGEAVPTDHINNNSLARALCENLLRSATASRCNFCREPPCGALNLGAGFAFGSSARLVPDADDITAAVKKKPAPILIKEKL